MNRFKVIIWSLSLAILGVGVYLFFTSETKQDIPHPPSREHEKEPPDHLVKSGARKVPITAGMILIPAGDFIRGADPAREKPIPESYGLVIPPYRDEQPRGNIFLPDFYIDKTEVSIGEYREFVEATGHPAPEYWSEYENLDKWRFYPVTFITWKDAVSYARWKGKRLPTEEEWEKAARGTGGRRYPWGNEFLEDKANLSGVGTIMTGWTLTDESPYGVLDMAGNVAEWTTSWYKPYSGSNMINSEFGEKNRVIRGGSWGGKGHYFLKEYNSRTSYRGFAAEGDILEDVGFRCAFSTPAAGKDEKVKVKEQSK